MGGGPERAARSYDILAKRVALWAGAALAVITLTATTVRIAQHGIQTAISDTREEVRAVRAEFNRRALADSVRFERVMTVVELAVVALVEPSGSAEQRDAVAELRKRRRVTHVQ